MVSYLPYCMDRQARAESRLTDAFDEGTDEEREMNELLRGRLIRITQMQPIDCPAPTLNRLCNRSESGPDDFQLRMNANPVLCVCLAACRGIACLWLDGITRSVNGSKRGMNCVQGKADS